MKTKTTLNQAVKNTFGRNYSKPIIEHLQAKGIKPLNNDCFTEKIVQDIVNGRSKNFEAENEIIHFLQERKRIEEKLNRVLEIKLKS